MCTKVLEHANIKLSSVPVEVMGKSGWNMVVAMLEQALHGAE